MATQKAGKKIGGKRKGKTMKKKDKQKYPSFNQMYKNRDILSHEDREFLEDFKERNRLSTLYHSVQENIKDEYDDLLVSLKSLPSKVGKKYKKKLENLHDLSDQFNTNKQSLVLFRVYGISQYEDLNIDPIDYENVLNMKKRMTNDYLYKLRLKHNNEHMKGAKNDIQYMKHSYQNFDKLKSVLQNFMDNWNKRSEIKVYLESKLPKENADIVDVHLYPKNPRNEHLYRIHDSKQNTSPGLNTDTSPDPTDTSPGSDQDSLSISPIPKSL